MPYSFESDSGAINPVRIRHEHEVVVLVPDNPAGNKYWKDGGIGRTPSIVQKRIVLGPKTGIYDLAVIDAFEVYAFSSLPSGIGI